jgi:hypothetical protein
LPGFEVCGGDAGGGGEEVDGGRASGPRLSAGGWATLGGDEADWVWWEEQESGGGGGVWGVRGVEGTDDVAGVRESAWADGGESIFPVTGYPETLVQCRFHRGKRP